MNFLLFLLKIIFFPVIYVYRKFPFKFRRTIASKLLGFLTFFKVFFSLFGSVVSFEKDKKNIRDKKDPQGVKLLYLAFFFTGLFSVWAYYAEFDQVITGEGKVFPFSRLQTIEHFEGGLLEKIHVSRGDSVNKNDLLVSLSPLQADSDYNIQSSNVALLGIKIARLEAEYANEDDFTIDKKIQNEFNDIFENEYFLFKRRRSLYKNELSQRVNNIMVSRVRVSSAQAVYVASGEELEITKLLVEKGLESKLSYIKAKRVFAESNSAKDIAMEELTIAKSNLVSFKIEAKTEVLNELSKVKADFMAATQGIRVAADKADRTQIRAPIDGIVNRVLISTEGSAVKAGETVVELVPADQTIVVEANILPADRRLFLISLFLSSDADETSFASSLSFAITFGVFKSSKIDSIIDSQGNLESTSTSDSSNSTL